MDLTVSGEERSLVMLILKHGVRAVLQERASHTAEIPSRPLHRAGTNPYLRRHEAAKYLGCSVRQIDKMKHDGDLPHHKVRRRLVRFKIDDLDALMKDHRISLDDDDPSSP